MKMNICKWEAYILLAPNAIKGGANPWIDNPEYDPWVDEENNGNG